MKLSFYVRTSKLNEAGKTIKTLHTDHGGGYFLNIF